MTPCEIPCPTPVRGDRLSRAGGNRLVYFWVWAGGKPGQRHCCIARVPGGSTSTTTAGEIFFCLAGLSQQCLAPCQCVAGGTPAASPGLSLLPASTVSVFRAPTCTSESLIDGAQVRAGGWRFAVGDRQQPDDGHLCVKLLGA